MQEATYTINGKTYTQRPLVLGQVKQLMELLKGVSIPRNADAFGLIEALDEKLPQALAIILQEDGIPLKDKNLSELSLEMQYGVTPEITLDIIDHFFELNPIASLLSRIGNLVQTIWSPVPPVPETASISSASFSPEVTGPSETPSSGE